MHAAVRQGTGLWSGHWVFVLALAGTTVGLGNVWRFPYLVGEHGGAAFILVYLGCVGLVGLPLMVAELFIGRRGRRSPVASMAAVSMAHGHSAAWAGVAVIGLLAGLLLLSAYSIVGGWSMAYVFRAAAGSFEGLDSVAVARLFRALVADPERMLAWHTLFLGAAMLIVARGLRHGLDEAVRWFVPLLVLALLVLAFQARGTGGFDTALTFLLRPDFARLDAGAVLAALGHAFFSLTLSVGAIAAFGRYAAPGTPLIRTAAVVVVLDTLIAVLAGLATFPYIFEAGMSPAAGPGLVFQTLPLAFAEMPGGRYLAVLFFSMLCLAAWTSAIAMLEPLVAWLAERIHVDRGLATSLVGVVVWLIGMASVLSFSLLSHVRLLPGWPGMSGSGTIFDVVNYVATTILLPIAGFGLAVFTGWRVSARTVRLDLGGRYGYRVWFFLIRFVTPLAMVLIALHATGLLARLTDWNAV